MFKKSIAVFCALSLILSQGLVMNVLAKDKTAPTFKSSTPKNNATGIATNVKIIIKFSENIYKGKNFTKIKLTKSGKAVSLTMGISKTTLTISHKAALAYGTSYVLSVPASSVKDKAGNLLKKATTIKFKTKVYVPVKGTRANPYLLNEKATFDGSKSYFNNYKIELTMTEVVRGDEAAQLVADGNQFNDIAPEGKEYILVKFKIKALSSKDDAKIDINESLFDFISATGVSYDDFISVAGLTPELTDLYAGGEEEGYTYQLIDKGDNPYVVFLDYENGGTWFKVN